jgi:hypothetical protein
MGLHLGVPHFVKNAVDGAKKIEQKVAPAIEHPVRTAQRAGKAIEGDAFELANAGVRHLTSQKDKALVHKELALAQIAADPSTPKPDRDAARIRMRKMMGAEPLDELDPLPGTTSRQAEKMRAASAQTWDPLEDPPSTPAQFASCDPAGHRKSDPVNLYLHGSLANIVRAFQKGGWSIAERGPAAASDYTHAMERYAKKSGEGVLPFIGGVSQALYHTTNTMPVGKLYLNGQLPQLSMEANNHPLTGRDHLRIFLTGKKDPQGQNIYAVTASRDLGIELDPKRRKTGFTNHFVEKSTDPERDFALTTLLASGEKVSVRETQRASAATHGGPHSVDGKVYDVTVG